MDSKLNTQGISVLVPSYNHAPFIERCLKSILKQTAPPGELLVIDDGSTDESAKIIDRVLKDSAFPCEFIARENRGLCATLNEGLERTNGALFAYLGSDDLWLPEFLTVRAGMLAARPDAVLAYGHAFVIDDKDRVIDCSLNWPNADFLDGDARQMVLQGKSLMSPTVVYRRASLEHRGWNKDAKLEDYELYLQLAHDGAFAFDKRILAAWRWHDYNTSSHLSLMLQEVLNAQARVLPGLGLTPEQTAQVGRTVKFQFVDMFVRKGHRKEGFNLFRHNLRGAASFSQLIRTATRLAIPLAVLQARRQRVNEKNVAQYGVVQI